MDAFSNLNLYLPEIIIFLGALISIVSGAFFKNNKYNKVLFLSFMTITISFSFILFSDISNESSSNNFVNTTFTNIVKLFVLTLAIGVLYVSNGYIKSNKLNLFEYPILLLFAVLGMLLMISANDLLFLYISIELQSLSLYVLVALNRDSLKSSEAALKYFILGSIASAIILYGISMTYSITGTTNYNLIKEFSFTDKNTLIFSFGLILILSGMAFKLSAAPFHMWTPDVYEGSPSSVTTILITIPKVVVFVALVKLLNEPFFYFKNLWQQIIIIIIVLSMAVGSIAALRQENIKRLFAYGTIANIGYVLIGVISNSNQGLSSSILYLVIYTIASLGIFSFIMMCRKENSQVVHLQGLVGLSQSNSFAAICMVMLLLSMAGIPPFAGFFAKFYIFIAAVESGFLSLAIIGVIFSVISAFYYLKIIKIMYMDSQEDINIYEVDNKMYLMLLITSLVMLVFIFFANDFINFLNKLNI
ncbi:MAG: NADH-quinone oxidoreductase subunit N [Alphaproteobacteria bacterium MarineAlpha9_Bin4]|nr:NADH-quinone oxidoreductase subunit N [Pelagibacterales bacterium]PPR27532.1 MAG: NADH-quinone oxidoreductase subunit N [Alphaproteobacteria bacterium MarineAlpha9_Bin4]|tara:strand:+ start:843 stop:2267 length:1425 start_codon:yes stop_codon:yes gene_type:complete